MAATAKATPSPEQLLMAFRNLARPGWPTVLEDALAHRIYGPAIRGLARNFGRRAFEHSRLAHSLPRPPAPPTPSQEGSSTNRSPYSKATGLPTNIGRFPSKTMRAKATTAGRFDARKAAANDLDDQEITA